MVLKCPLCGMKFERPDVACRGCPLLGSCRLAKCPNCGYEFPLPSRLLERLILGGEKSGEGERNG